MALTKSELLHQRSKAICDICHKEKVLDSNWRMTEGKDVVCPACVPVVLAAGKVIVNF